MAAAWSSANAAEALNKAVMAIAVNKVFMVISSIVGFKLIGLFKPCCFGLGIDYKRSVFKAVSHVLLECDLFTKKKLTDG